MQVTIRQNKKYLVHIYCSLFYAHNGLARAYVPICLFQQSEIVVEIEIKVYGMIWRFFNACTLVFGSSICINYSIVC